MHGLNLPVESSSAREGLQHEGAQRCSVPHLDDRCPALLPISQALIKLITRLI
jgi:hypothetical protein